MIKALQLLFEPAKGWDDIARRERGVAAVLFVVLLPSALLASIVEGFGLVHYGNSPTHLGLWNHRWVAVSQTMAFRYEAGQVLMTVVVVFLLTIGFQLILRSFHCRATFAQSFTLMSYSYGPLLLLQMVDGIPAVPTWICRIVGGVLAIKIFYMGLGRVVRPDPSTALGLYFIGSFLILGLAGISHFVVLQIIEGTLFAKLFALM